MMKSISLLKKYTDKLPELDWLEPVGYAAAMFPKEWGLYLFKDKCTGRIDYIGSATGHKGLYQRLRNQHFQPSYKKSVFRLKIEKARVGGEPCCSAAYIMENYEVAILPVPEHISIIKAIEQILIFEYSPKFNSETTKHNAQSRRTHKCAAVLSVMLALHSNKP